MVVLVGAVVLTALMTYPLAFKLSGVGRIDSGDGQLSIWNVAWVAHAIIDSPARLYQANIFHPHADTLAYSESNIGAGSLALPAYWLTRNPYFAHNVVVLLAFTLSAAGAYFLVKHLTRHRGAAAVAAIAFAYCPYVFARTAHIQLLMTAGLPFSLLAFHRVADSPTAGRAIVLGLVLVAQALSCAYYGVFVSCAVALGALYYACDRGRWRDRRYWTALTLAALVAIWAVLPFLMPYVRLQRESGFVRTIDETLAYSADWRAYFASAAWAHQWMLPWLGTWNDVLFPGFLTTLLGGFGFALAVAGSRTPVHAPAREPDDEATAALLGRPFSSPVDVAWPRFYALMAVLAAWMSFGPRAGLYKVAYHLLPVFDFLRAPARFGVLVALALTVLMALGILRLAERSRSSGRLFVLLAIAAVAELATLPLGFREVQPLPEAYRTLATLRRGPVIELPFYYNPIDFHRHTLYMLNSTGHWFPLINGYSDHIPPDFREMAIHLSSFPTLESFRILAPRGTRYAIFHLNLYDTRSRLRLMQRLDQYQPFLRPIFRQGDVWLYEIVDWPR
ncbi:MAG: hypothetical protein HYS05_05800 [Acidobacteria bacterium]|nr:hypothetical protein [Acidobacteriota bacterium]